jgi:hypothetical protein
MPPVSSLVSGIVLPHFEGGSAGMEAGLVTECGPTVLRGDVVPTTGP